MSRTFYAWRCKDSRGRSGACGDLYGMSTECVVALVANGPGYARNATMSAGTAASTSGVTLCSGTRLGDVEEPGAVPLQRGSAVDV